MNNRTVIVITGPTASGKTSLGVSLALALGTEVVSADSMQLYRGMDIGSAKPTREEMRGIVRGFDSFTVVLETDGKQQLIYKHAISTLVPSQSVDMTGGTNT